jgi:hypothetical protein
MLSYYISKDNIKTVRVNQLSGSSLVWEVENLYTYQKHTSSLSNYEYDNYQSLLTFTASLDNAEVGEQYRAKIKNGNNTVWHGSIEVFTSQSVLKSEPNNQIPLDETYISHETENEFIILD